MPNEAVKVEKVPMEAAYRRLGEIVRRVSDDNEVFLLLKNGLPVAAVIDVAEFERCILEPNKLALRFGKEGVVIHSSAGDAEGGARGGKASPTARRRPAKTRS